MQTAASLTDRHNKPSKGEHRGFISKPSFFEPEELQDNEDKYDTHYESDIDAPTWRRHQEIPFKSATIQDGQSLQPIQYDFDSANNTIQQDDGLTEELFRQASEKLLDPPNKSTRDVWHIITADDDPTEEIDEFWEDTRKHSWCSEEARSRPWPESDADELNEQRVRALWPNFSIVFSLELGRLTSGGASTRALERLHKLAASGAAQVARSAQI
jgi:hypothetical protein